MSVKSDYIGTLFLSDEAGSLQERYEPFWSILVSMQSGVTAMDTTAIALVVLAAVIAIVAVFYSMKPESR